MSSPPVVPPPSGPPTSAPAPRSRYAMGSAANMARSLLVILGLVAVLLMIVPRSDGVSQPAVDAASVVSVAVKDSGVAFEFPAGLPAGWKATSARYAAATDSVPTWQAGWTTPSGQFVGLRQAMGVTPRWLDVATNAASNAAGAVSTQDLGGRTWQRLRDDRGQVHLVATAPSGLTTVVSASSEQAEFAVLVEALRPAPPAS
ncbi:MAG: DUF4245 domain-containing protein [Dermatophilaceae bacterium]